MPLLKTTDDLALTIRQRRKALGWDQAGLAERAGVSRQWIIDIEKGKPRAELHLVLRVINVLGLRLSAEAPVTDRLSSMHPAPSIDAVVASHRDSSNPTSVTAAGTERASRSTGYKVDYGRIIHEIEHEFGLKPGFPASKREQPTHLPSGKHKK